MQMITEEDSLISAVNQPRQVLSNVEMPSDEDLETFRIVFELFDRDHSGFIDNHDLAAISLKLNKDPQESKYSCAWLYQYSDSKTESDNSIDVNSFCAHRKL